MSPRFITFFTLFLAGSFLAGKHIVGIPKLCSRFFKNTTACFRFAPAQMTDLEYGSQCKQKYFNTTQELKDNKNCYYYGNFDFRYLVKNKTRNDLYFSRLSYQTKEYQEAQNILETQYYPKMNGFVVYYDPLKPYLYVFEKDIDPNQVMINIIMSRASILLNIYMFWYVISLFYEHYIYSRTNGNQNDSNQLYEKEKSTTRALFSDDENDNDNSNDDSDNSDNSEDDSDDSYHDGSESDSSSGSSSSSESEGSNSSSHSSDEYDKIGYDYSQF